MKRDAQRITAINLKLASLAQLPDFAVNSAHSNIAIYWIIASIIAETGTANLKDRDTLAEIIRRGRQYPGDLTDNYRYGADRLLTYFNFVSDALEDEDEIYRLDLLFRYFVRPDTLEGSRLNMPSQMTEATLVQMADYFSRQPRPNTDSDFYALSDYGEFVGPRMILRDCSLIPRLPQCNDPQFSAYMFGVFYEKAVLKSISVDAENASKISATLHADGTVQVDRRAGFFGYAYFDYTVATDGALEAKGRYYVKSLAYQ